MMELAESTGHLGIACQVIVRLRAGEVVDRHRNAALRQCGAGQNGSQSACGNRRKYGSNKVEWHGTNETDG